MNLSTFMLIALCICQARSSIRILYTRRAELKKAGAVASRFKALRIVHPLCPTAVSSAVPTKLHLVEVPGLWGAGAGEGKGKKGDK